MRRGDVVAGKYRLERELGSGSQGRVWEGVHLQMGTPLAVKVLDPNLARRPDYVSRFKREASAAAALRSPHVVQIFDFGIWEDVPYIAMEKLVGENLGSRLDRIGRLPPTTVAAIVTQVSRALLRAHNRNIIHRDMKPDNIFLCSDDDGEVEVVKILDFGVAKAVGNFNLARTGTGIVLGTPYYMSPEQAQGERQIDHRTDLWALGVITFEALIGRRPFEATNLGDLLIKICATNPPRPSDLYSLVPDGFDEWFLKACARDPADRFSSAKEMAATLAIICGCIPANLSDSSYVALFAQPSQPAPPDAERGPLSSTIGENEPTQVMTELPEGVRLEVEKHVKVIDLGPIAPRKESLKNLESRSDKKNQPTDPRPTSSSPPKPNPVIPTSSTLKKPKTFRPEPISIEDEDPVEMFDAASIAADMARFKEEKHQEDVRAHRRALLVKAKWPAVALLLLLVVAITAAVTVLSR